MPYTVTNYPSKVALKRDLEAGKMISVYQPGPFGPEVKDGQVCLEGPHYPQPHRWYATAQIEDGVIVGKIK